MKKLLIAVLVGGALLVPGLVAAEVMQLEPMVVTATRVETPISEVGSSVTLIPRAEIERRQAVHLLDVLRGVPGLDVVRQGGAGQQASVFLRGANSGHTLVLVDGIEVNDPSNPSRAFDFAAMPVENIERIEIVRGPGSTLYGSDAMGGVINIITRRGAGQPKVSLSAEGGSYETHQEKFSLRGGTEMVNYSVAATWLNSAGISAAGEKYGNSERDGYERKSLSSRFGLTPNEVLDIDIFYRYLDAEADLDAFAGTFGDDPNNTLNSRSDYFRAQAQLALFDGFWQQTLGVSLTDYDRSNDDKADADRPLDTVKARYDSQFSKLDWQHNFNLSQANTLTFGAEYEEETAEGSFFSTSSFGSFASEIEKATVRTTGYYLQDQARFNDNLVVTAGARLDDHSRFGSEETWRLTASYRFPSTGTRFRGSYGTAFKAPTLSQLFEVTTYGSGNPDLAPEKSRGWDFGVEQTLLEQRIQLGATWFHNRFDNLISNRYNVATGKFEWLNIDDARTRGLELTLEVQPVDSVSIAAGYTYTDTEDRATGQELLRRPSDKYNLNVNYRPLEQAELTLELLHVGKREDFDSEPPFAVTTLSAYTVVNLMGAYSFSEALRLTGRIENLLDEKYEEVSGYGTPGIAGYVGASLSF